MTKHFRFKKIDAFATSRSDGNPAGCVALDPDETITAEEMQRIARELRGFVSEVGFVRRTGERELSLEYFSAEREVEFCGHATIAIMADLVANDAELSRVDSLTVRTNRGVLPVENLTHTENAVFIMSPEPRELACAISRQAIAAALGTAAAALRDDLPTRIIDAGLRTLIVPFASLPPILALSPDLEELKAFCVASGVDIIEVFSAETSSSGSNYRVRVFAPTFGYLEDPATGSGNSALGYYLHGLGLWTDGTLTIEQNASEERFNVVKLRLRRDESGAIRVLFGGGAVVRIRGEYLLP